MPSTYENSVHLNIQETKDYPDTEGYLYPPYMFIT